jgi:hypothetical protein
MALGPHKHVDWKEPKELLVSEVLRKETSPSSDITHKKTLILFPLEDSYFLL